MDDRYYKFLGEFQPEIPDIEDLPLADQCFCYLAYLSNSAEELKRELATLGEVETEPAKKYIAKRMAQLKKTKRNK